ncbi:putative FeS-containing Cyanobacterial-specific oxidoreductase [Slackia heliotrinireducens]|uniref:Fe-S oxidoreductase n=1 Tax=Slackia heliotrinireducens (strain ATCC 29202 / DSM 20476 / NCTC 11029 / RHS 1) TaxID=471855 RepID=C7N522_SLAHD|nr:DUF512 domain-containing protein [Slackia heliotrinireducens]ACV22007.1 Fe-S oxidoreductase [Slackia heliotrinireducens DSM 20476]VEG99915.1 putative FeS-containing Cyanobacterial-specific oxidoreductase [Slackia heliotrinireducens]
MTEKRTVHEYPGNPARPMARILEVEEYSPAFDAGFEPGCIVTAVNGHPLRDMIDWQWYSDGYEVELSYIDLDGDEGTVVLEREEGESWGITFDGAIFDGIRVCRNACMFCFMRMLPKESRDTLMLRDDDWRLSFLQGNFTTLTNLSEEDADEITERHVSPLRVSLHCISPEVRSKMIGRHADHGVRMMEKLLAGGIELYMQIVLLPGVNDGAELMKTLAWAYLHEGIANVGIVPLGFTKHQTAFDKSFNDREAALEVVEAVEAFQKHAMAERGCAWVYLADEFYSNAYPDDLLDHLPPAEHYGAFDMFEDGIGIIRSFVDDWQQQGQAVSELAQVLEDEGVRVYYVFGEAMRETFTPLVEASPLKGLLIPLYVKNEFFGGNVDVTGLLSGVDVARAIRGVSAHDYVVLPRVMFNSDMITLDDMTVDDIRDTAGMPVTVVSCNAYEFLPEIRELVEGY